MGKFYKELFHAPKHGKVEEKTMLARVVTTVAIMVFCLIAMSISAYAYFSHNVTSDFTVIESAIFKTKVEIADENGNPVDITPVTSNYVTHKLEGLEVGEFYTITVTPTEASTAQTGFIVVSANNCEIVYHTQQIGVDTTVENGYTPSLTFKIKITSATDVVLFSHWGTSSCYDDYKSTGDNEEKYIINNDKVTLVIGGVTESVQDAENQENASEVTNENEELLQDGEENVNPSNEETEQ